MYWYDASIFPPFFEIHFFYPHLVPIVRDQTLTFSSPFSLKILGCILIYALRDMYHPFFGYFVFTPRAFPLLVLWTFTFTFFCTLYTLNSHHPFSYFCFTPLWETRKSITIFTLWRHITYAFLTLISLVMTSLFFF